MRIEKVEVRVVAPPGARFTWSHDIPEQYMTNTIVRVFTDEGLAGVGGAANYTSFHYDKYTAETLRHLAPILIGRNPLERESIWHALRPRVFPIAPLALAAVDIALWDLLGKAAGLPLYQLLGGARDRIPAYASTPLLADIPAYLQFVEDQLEQGFRAVKFHTWCLPEKDLQLSRAVRKQFKNSDVDFMLDVENNYDRVSALRVAQELEDLGFGWFEAPFPDYELESYRELTNRVNIPVLPSGNWVQDLPSFQRALQCGAWRVARTDCTALGGITPVRKAMCLAEAAGMNCELMCWGYTLIAAANLHVMLAFGNGTYFEQAVPTEVYEYGMQDVIRAGSDGYVSAPDGPGLGVEVDWAAMDRATLMVYDVM